MAVTIFIKEQLLFLAACANNFYPKGKTSALPTENYKMAKTSIGKVAWNRTLLRHTQVKPETPHLD